MGGSLDETTEMIDVSARNFAAVNTYPAL